MAKAIIWSGEKMFQKIMEILRTTGSLKGQIMAVLDFIETEMSESRCSTQLMRLQGQECRMKGNLYREFNKIRRPPVPGGECAPHSHGTGKAGRDHPCKDAGNICDHGIDGRIYELFCIPASGTGDRGGSERADERIFTEKYSAGFQQQRRTEIRERGFSGKRDSLSLGMKDFIFYIQMRAGRLYLWVPQPFPE